MTAPSDDRAASGDAPTAHDRSRGERADDGAQADLPPAQPAASDHPATASAQPATAPAQPAASDHPATVLRPLGLGFVDRALEQAWWRHHAHERGPSLRVGIALLYASAIFFGRLDTLLFPSHAATLGLLRAGMVALLLVPAPLVFLPSLRPRFEVHAQGLLAYLTAVSVAALLAMTWVVVPGSDRLQLYHTLMAGLFALLCIHFASGLRVAYAAPIGLVAVAAYLTILVTRARPSTGDLFVLLGYLAAEWTVSLTACWALERAGRLDFLARVVLDEAHRRSEALLLNLVPGTLAARHAAGERALDRLPRATVLFATLDGFDRATAQLSPVDAVRLLDRIVARFDQLARTHGAERIKTIGATYMAATGVVTPSDTDALDAARLALALRDDVRELATHEGLPLALRAGLATGPVVAGIIGRTRIAFDCWGDTANLAARLDSHGCADRIQVAASTAALVSPHLSVTPRGPIALKGKGPVETFWLDAGAEAP